MNIDLRNGFRFVARRDTWFVGGVELTSDCTTWTADMEVRDGWGFFSGLTMETYKGYDGELPREDEESCSFDEFDIYYGDVLVNGDECLTYGELSALVRDARIGGILENEKREA